MEKKLDQQVLGKFDFSLTQVDLTVSASASVSVSVSVSCSLKALWADSCHKADYSGGLVGRISRKGSWRKKKRTTLLYLYILPFTFTFTFYK